MNSEPSNCAAPLRRNAAPLMRRCLSLEHVCKHTAVNKCANRGRGSAQSRVALFFLGHEAAAVVCCFSSLCLHSPEPRHQIVAAGKKKTPHAVICANTTFYWQNLPGPIHPSPCELLHADLALRSKRLSPPSRFLFHQTGIGGRRSSSKFFQFDECSVFQQA